MDRRSTAATRSGAGLLLCHLAALLLFTSPSSLADVYMHNPRGSNDRGCETNDNRNNVSATRDNGSNWLISCCFSFLCFKQDKVSNRAQFWRFDVSRQIGSRRAFLRLVLVSRAERVLGFWTE